MGLLGSLAMLVPLTCLFWLPVLIMAQSTPMNGSARALDALLQDYAFRAFVVRPKTGIPYDGVVPSNLSGINITAMRLRSGSLRSKGVKMYKEFEIPIGVVEQPYVERLVLVYQNLGDWSKLYYPLPNYSYLAPVLGLLAYNASNLSATNLPELDFRAFGDPIKIKFSDVQSTPDGSVPMCVWFDLHGSVNFSNVTSGNECSTIQQGHFSIVTGSISPSGGGEEKKSHRKVGIIVGSVLGGLALLVLLAVLVLWARKCKQTKEMQEMEKAAEVGEALHMTSVGDTKAPSATVTRTQPTLESEYVP
ncbi:hypothetical protein QUC31_017298 [Theobroma cacao]|uniref:Uncharacterized protein LOC18602174 n=2 Tax=Theobroma cacao TaxID=3641 RepID=A0AB32VA30_THECC|nr:PREDICTED: uncharacterized protein LOC18602174 [Theobroma cacao]EOY04383.1 Uncharacterized protein TCM_019649 [Theobroma cacao]